MTRLPRSFWNVRPRGDLAERQQDFVQRILRGARDAAVDVLVLPELCIDRAGAELLLAERQRLDNEPAILVAGSHHAEDDDGHRRNTCWAVVGRGGRLEHHKFERFEYDCPRTGGCRVEDIHTAPRRIRLYCGAPWSLTLLICRDALSEPVQRLLRELRPGLVLVPSFSLKTSPFIPVAEALANANQAFVVIANGPVPPDRVVGIFGHPPWNQCFQRDSWSRRPAPGSALRPAGVLC